MYYYKIGYVHYEGKYTIILAHEKYYSSEEFKELMAKAYIQYYEKHYLELSDKYLNEIQYIFERIESGNFIEYLHRNYNFEILSTEASFIPFGEYDPNEESERREYEVRENSDNDLIHKYVETK